MNGKRWERLEFCVVVFFFFCTKWTSFRCFAIPKHIDTDTNTSKLIASARRRCHRHRRRCRAYKPLLCCSNNTTAKRSHSMRQVECLGYNSNNLWYLHTCAVLVFTYEKRWLSSAFMLTKILQPYVELLFSHVPPPHLVSLVVVVVLIITHTIGFGVRNALTHSPILSIRTWNQMI